MFESHYANHYRLAGKSPKTPLHDPNWGKNFELIYQPFLNEFQSMTGIQLSAKNLSFNE